MNITSPSTRACSVYIQKATKDCGTGQERYINAVFSLQARRVGIAPSILRGKQDNKKVV